MEEGDRSWPVSRKQALVNGDELHLATMTNRGLSSVVHLLSPLLNGKHWVGFGDDQLVWSGVLPSGQTLALYKPLLFVEKFIKTEASSDNCPAQSSYLRLCHMYPGVPTLLLQSKKIIEDERCVQGGKGEGSREKGLGLALHPHGQLLALRHRWETGRWILLDGWRVACLCLVGPMASCSLLEALHQCFAKSSSPGLPETSAQVSVPSVHVSPRSGG